MPKFTDPLNHEFEFPRGLLNQISECSPLGFLIFYYDGFGDPQLRAEFDCRGLELGLRTHAQKMLKNLDIVEDQQIRENIVGFDEGFEED